jgi:hypothetical protein
MLKLAGTTEAMAELINRSLPPRWNTVRIHVGGDFFSQAYFDAWLEVAVANPKKIFYAYTKSINFWAERMLDIPGNFRLTASLGGRYDNLAERLGLKTAEVVLHPNDAKAKKLPLDHDDSHAYGRSMKPFALLIHGQQKKASEAAAAVKVLKEEGVDYTYSNK